MKNTLQFIFIFFGILSSLSVGAQQAELTVDGSESANRTLIKVSATDRGVGFDHLNRESDPFKDCLLQLTPDRLVEPAEVFLIWDICKDAGGAGSMH